MFTNNWQKISPRSLGWSLEATVFVLVFLGMQLAARCCVERCCSGRFGICRNPLRHIVVQRA